MTLRFGGLLALLASGHVGPAAAASAQSPSSPVVQQEFTITENYTYQFNMLVGTPPQMVTVALDFGSADLILKDGFSPCVGTPCNWQGEYPTVNFNASKSLRRNNSYTTAPLSSDGVVVSGNWACDNVSFGSPGLSASGKTTFLIQYDSLKYYTSDDIYSGYEQMNSVFGLGPRGLQVTVHWMDAAGVPGPSYDSIFHPGKGNAPASFSIWTDPISYRSGILTLGGVDQSLYVPGSLVSMPIAIPEGMYGSFAEPVYLGVEYFAINIMYRNRGRQWQNQSMMVPTSVAILNSRQNFSLPVPMLEDVGMLLSAEWASSEGMYVVRCDLEGSIGIQLPVLTLQIPFEDLLIPLSMEDMSGSPLCGLNIGESDQVYLSNQVLRRYFLAVDYGSNQIAFGNLSSGPNSGQPSRVSPINSSIPGASKIPSSEFVTAIDPSFETVFEVFTNAPPAITPHFYPSQTTNLVLGTNPLPSILSPDNYSELLSPSSVSSNAASTTGRRLRLVDFVGFIVLLLF